MRQCLFDALAFQLLELVPPDLGESVILKRTDECIFGYPRAYTHRGEVADASTQPVVASPRPSVPSDEERAVTSAYTASVHTQYHTV